MNYQLTSPVAKNFRRLRLIGGEQPFIFTASILPYGFRPGTDNIERLALHQRIKILFFLSATLEEKSMTHLRRFQNTAWLLAFAASAGALSFTPPAYAGVFGISEQEEIQAGRQVAQQARQEYGGSLPYNHPMSVRVRALGQKFTRLSQRKNIPYSYEVLNNDKILNAFAAPGGPIFVTKKLVSTTSNDAELAYVLGHETAHIDRQHIVKQVERQQKVGLGVGILGAILGGRGSSNIFSVFSNVAFTVWSRGYSRDMENESDTVGVRWMSQLGFDPRAAITMLGKLDGGGNSGITRYLATHPAPKDRQERVQSLINSENLVNVATRSGGPFLNARDLPEFNYSNTSTYDASRYPDDTSYNPPDYGVDDGVRDARLASFGAPLLLVNTSNYSVISAPVGGFARWARANISANEDRSDVVTIQRGRNSIRLRRNSRIAVINGRNVTMPTAAQVYNNLLYAPLGNLAEGVGAEASLSNDSRTIWLTMDGQRWYMHIR